MKTTFSRREAMSLFGAGIGGLLLPSSSQALAQSPQEIYREERSSEFQRRSGSQFYDKCADLYMSQALENSTDPSSLNILYPGSGNDTLPFWIGIRMLHDTPLERVHFEYTEIGDSRVAWFENIKDLREGVDNQINWFGKLTKLRDVNPIYAGLWRSYLRWFNTEGEGYLKHPLGNLNKKVTFTAYLRLMNVKANHRKVITADENGETVSIITSANPHEASSKHGNVAIRIKNSIAKDILKSEKEIAKFSGHDFDIENKLKLVKNTEGNIDVQLLTERQIRDSLVKEINNLNEGESIEMVMFYLSDRIVVNSLLEASERGVNIRIILDPNKDAFAKEKNGIPNRQVAYELFKESKGKIEVRWYNTQGEQQHTKLIVIRKHNETIIFLGSSNLTKRNIGNFNLEANIKIITPKETEIDLEIREFFYKFWNNLDGEYTLNFDNYKEDSFPKYQLYIFQESTGLSSF